VSLLTLQLLLTAIPKTLISALGLKGELIVDPLVGLGRQLKKQSKQGASNNI